MKLIEPKGFTVWGITGGIGSGKSRASYFLRQKGYEVIDMDQVARDLTFPGKEGWLAVQKEFGKDYFGPDGLLDRKKLAEAVFAGKNEKRRLEGILHPIMEGVINNKLALCVSGSKQPLFIDSAILIESDCYKTLSGLLVVLADLEVRKLRALARKGMTGQLFENIVKNQVSDKKRQELADYVIFNNSGLSELRAKLERFVGTILKNDPVNNR